MSLNRWAKRRDQNEHEIVAALIKAGCQVVQLDVFDLLVLRGEQLFMLEVKAPKGGLTEAQHRMLMNGWPLHIVRDVDDALEVVFGKKLTKL